MAKKLKRVEEKRSHAAAGTVFLLAVFLGLVAGLVLANPARALHALDKVRVRVCPEPVPAAPAAVSTPKVAVAEGANLDAEIVGAVSEESLAPSLALLQKAQEGATIHLHIASPGGDGFAMLYWLDALDQARSRRHVKLVCHAGGIVASAAAIIFEACDVRSASAAAVWLFHGVSSMAAGKAGNVEDSARLMRVLDMAVAARIAPHLGMTPDEYTAWVDRHDRFLTTAELSKLDRDLSVL